MAIRVFCRISDPFGNPLVDVANGFVLDYKLTTVPGNIGVAELTVNPDFNRNYLLPDGLLSIYRSIDGRTPYIDNNAVFLMETFKESRTSVFIRAYHAKTLATRRYVLYNSGTTFANKTATFADNLIKAFWRENAGSLIDSSRDGSDALADLSTYVQVAADRSLGPSVAMSGSRDPLDSVLQRICDASATAGTYLTYDIVRLSNTLLELRTYTTVYGIDRTVGSDRLILGENRGNLENTSATTDYHGEVTFAAAGGVGQQSERLIQTTLDTTRASISPFHRIERFLDMSNVSSTAVLQDDADSGVRASRPVVVVNGDLIQTAKCTRGIHYDLGDIVTFESVRTGNQFDVRLEMVQEHYDASRTSSSQPLSAHQKTVQRTLTGLRSL